MRYMSFFFSSRRRHTTCGRDWSSDVCSSDLCVGSKTRQLLEKNGFKVLETKEYAENLVPIIQQKFSKKHIAFFAGNIRRNTLPEAMQEKDISFDEYLVYQNRSEERRVGKELRSR